MEPIKRIPTFGFTGLRAIVGALADMVGYHPHQARPFRNGKHASGHRKSPNWAARRIIRRKMAKASRKINRRK